MRNNSIPVNWPSRIARLTGVLSGILLLAVLASPQAAVAAAADTVTLAWGPSPGVAGYRIHYGATSGNYTSSVEVGNAMTATVPGLANGVTYYFVVTSYDANGLESTFSNEISFAPGGANVQLHVTANRQAVLTVSGPVGNMYDIQATPNFTSWTVIGNVTVGATGSADFTDVNAASFPKRFYRALATP